jgi:hypothetical protein
LIPKALALGARGLIGVQKLECLPRDRVDVPLSEKPLLDEYVQARRKRAGAHLSLEEVDGPSVLFAAEDELRFLLALRQLLPDRHRGRGHDRHDGEGHEQGSHRVAVLSARPE